MSDLEESIIEFGKITEILCAAKVMKAGAEKHTENVEPEESLEEALTFSPALKDGDSSPLIAFPPVPEYISR